MTVKPYKPKTLARSQPATSNPHSPRTIKPNPTPRIKSHEHAPRNHTEHIEVHGRTDRGSDGTPQLRTRSIHDDAATDSDLTSLRRGRESDAARSKQRRRR
nr:unnamed protein product [Digitaria exilis]